jgi:hypothetical protein
MANAQENKDTYFKDAISYALENKADAKKAKLKVKTAPNSGSSCGSATENFC